MQSQLSDYSGMNLDAGRSGLRDNPRRHFAFGLTECSTEHAEVSDEPRSRRRLAEVSREHGVGILNFSDCGIYFWLIVWQNARSKFSRRLWESKYET